jgi:uncharacterized protein YcgI (DUF1989 family)
MKHLEKNMEEVLIEGGFAGRMNLLKGEILEVENVDGHQVCDFFAFKKDEVKEFLSPSHMRSVMRRTFIKENDLLYSILRNPMLRVVRDEVGIHDFCVPACDPMRYSMDFNVSDHKSCRCNLADITKDLNIPYEYLPDPLNLFQETSVNSKGLITGGISPALPGQKIVLEALMDLIVVGSACPQDLAPTNNFNPTRIRLRKVKESA